jgi:hypothetical protein
VAQAVGGAHLAFAVGLQALFSQDGVEQLAVRLRKDWIGGQRLVAFRRLARSVPRRACSCTSRCRACRAPLTGCSAAC